MGWVDGLCGSLCTRCDLPMVGLPESICSPNAVLACLRYYRVRADGSTLAVAITEREVVNESYKKRGWPCEGISSGRTPRKEKKSISMQRIRIARCRQMATNMGISGFAEEVPPRGMPRPPQWNSFYSQQGIEGAADVNY